MIWIDLTLTLLGCDVSRVSVSRLTVPVPCIGRTGCYTSWEALSMTSVVSHLRRGMISWMLWKMWFSTNSVNLMKSHNMYNSVNLVQRKPCFGVKKNQAVNLSGPCRGTCIWNAYAVLSRPCTKRQLCKHKISQSEITKEQVKQTNGFLDEKKWS